MAQNYTVNYDIKVHSSTAIQAIDKFVASTSKLSTTVAEVDKLTASLKTLTKTAYKLSFNVGNANRSLDSVIRRLKTIQKLASQTATIHVNQSGAGKGSAGKSSTTNIASGSGSKGGSGKNGGKQGGNTPNKPNTPQGNQNTAAAVPSPKGSRSMYRNPRSGARPNNYAYKTLGPSMIDSGGIGAVSLLKGMGIMYGITGLGSMMGNIIRQSTEYDNVMQTTKNILGVHDKSADFASKFYSMERNVRNVGMETRFTAPEVADASKFLAMAGMDVNAINHAIRPIADIALIGDTDLGSTADMMTNIMKGFEIAPERMRNAADVMVSTFTSSNTTLPMLAESYKYAAAILTNAGVDFETASGALGVLGNAGRQGSMGGTDLRMIMQNIMNPTKKQKAAWKSLGITPYDSKGNLKPINEIFGELHDKDVSAQQVMQMFRTTAAPGAMLLARHVDDWNEIIERNRSSAGISDELSEAKKNTIQGLWAQLTSVFTEDGLVAFEGLQEQIRDFLRNIIETLKDPSATDAIRTFGTALLDILKSVKEFTKVFVDFYQRFGSVIKHWIQFQLVVSSILIPLRAFRGLMHLGGYIGASVRSIGALTMQMGSLRSSILGVTATRGRMTQFWASLNAGGATNLGYIPASGLKEFTSIKGRKFENLSRQNLMDYQRRVNKIEAQRAKMTAAAGVGGMVGAGLGAWAGSNIGEEGSVTRTVGIIGGSIGGMALGSYLASMPAWLAPLLTNPATWVVGAVAAFGVGAYQISKSIKEGIADTEQWVQKFRSLNIEGMNLTKSFGLMMAYARIESSGKSEEEKAKLRKEAFNHYQDQGKSDVQLPDDSQAFINIPGGETLKDALYHSNDWYGKYQRYYGKLVELGMTASPRIIAGDEYTDYFLNGTKVYDAVSHGVGPWRKPGFGGSMSDSQALVASLILSGRDRNSPLMQRISDIAMNDLYSVGRAKDLPAVWERISSTYIPADTYAYSKYSVGEYQEMPFSQLSHSDMYVLGLRLAFQELQKQFQPWESLLQSFDAGSTITTEQTDRVMAMFWKDYFNPDKFVFGSADFKANLQNFVNSQDKQTAQESINKTFTDLLEFFNKLDTQYKPLFAAYLNRNIWEDALPKGFTLPDGGYMGGTKDVKSMESNGKRYEWTQLPAPYQTGMKGWVSKDGSIFSPKDAKQENQGINFGGKGHKDANGKYNPAETSSNNRGHVDVGDYKNHYNKGNAMPKQVIVRIGNLMNVDKIDLSKKDNAEVVDNLKGMLAEALIDVVRDFEMNSPAT